MTLAPLLVTENIFIWFLECQINWLLVNKGWTVSFISPMIPANKRPFPPLCLVLVVSKLSHEATVNMIRITLISHQRKYYCHCEHVCQHANRAQLESPAATGRAIVPTGMDAVLHVEDMRIRTSSQWYCAKTQFFSSTMKLPLILFSWKLNRVGVCFPDNLGCLCLQPLCNHW